MPFCRRTVLAACLLLAQQLPAAAAVLSPASADGSPPGGPADTGITSSPAAGGIAFGGPSLGGPGFAGIGQGAPGTVTTDGSRGTMAPSITVLASPPPGLDLSGVTIAGPLDTAPRGGTILDSDGR
jgi:hypothetical protein